MKLPIHSLILFIVINMIPVIVNGSIQKNIENNHYNSSKTADTSKLLNQILEIDALIKISKEKHDVLEEVRMLKKKGDLYNKNCLYTTALTIYRKVLDIIANNKTTPELKQLKIDILLGLDRICYFTGKYETGISYMYELLKTNNNENLMYNISAYSSLGSLFLMSNKPDIAHKYLKEASDLLEITNPKDSIVIDNKYTVYNCLASMHSLNKNYDSSIYYLQKARNNCNNDINKMNIIYQNTAALYTELDEWEIAEEYFLKALSIEKRPYERVVIMNNLSFLYLKQKMYSKSLELCQQAMKSADEINAFVIKGSLTHIMVDLHVIKGDYKKAFEYKTIEQSINDSIFNKEMNERIMTMNNDFELYEIESDKKLLEYKVEIAELTSFKRGIIIAIVSILFIIVLIVSAFITKGFLKQRKYNKTLKTTIDKFDEEKQEIIHSSKEKFETEISDKARELTANAIFIAKMCEVANNLSDNINKLKKQCKGNDTELIFEEIQRSINSLTIEDKGWEDFKIYFEQVHQSFFPNLNAAHPDLTPGETRMCAFIIMNLSTKEIASLTNRSVRTVDTIKFRVRRKLDIKGNLSTYSYLKKFM